MPGIYKVYTLKIKQDSSGHITSMVAQYHGSITADSFNDGCAKILITKNEYDKDDNSYAGWPCVLSEESATKFVKLYNQLRGLLHDKETYQYIRREIEELP